MKRAPRGGLMAPTKLLPYGPDQPVVIRLMSDLHVGAANVDYRLIRKEINQAIEHGHRIAINGDVFDAIVGLDKRSTPDVMHPKIRGRRDPINAAIEWACELFSGAENLIDVIGVGNHEVTLEKWAGTDVVKILVHELQKKVTEDGHRVHYGGYTGFIDYRFRVPGRKPSKSGSGNNAAPNRLVIYYHHGSGGAAPVTGGLINFNRKAVWVNADVIWMGHMHNRLCRDTETVGLSLRGLEKRRKQLYVMTGSYFDTYAVQSQESYARRGRVSNYAADMGLAPQGKGGALLKVGCHYTRKSSLQLHLTVEL